MIYKRECLFLLRQFSSKMRNTCFVLGTLSLLFTFALVGSSFAFMLSDYQNRQLDVEYPFDIIILSDDTENDFAEEERLINKNAALQSVLKYNVYQNGTSDMGDFLYQNLRIFGDKDKDPVMAEGKRAVAYYDYDVYMGISDYNCLREMLGLTPVALQDSQYLIHLSNRVYQEIKDKRPELENSVHIGLDFAGFRTEGFAQNGHNGADYIKIGTEELFLMPATIQVKSREVLELKFLMSTLSFPLFYIGLVFLCVSLTVLSVQQLSDSHKYKFRYQILHMLGMGKRKIGVVVAKQLFFYYLCPVILSILVSVLFIVKAGQQFVAYTGIRTEGALYFSVSLGGFLGVYVFYFVLTYFQFMKNIR